jgi:acyl-CoA thioesterase
MVNGFGVTHGGIAFSLADSAFAFACNTNGKVTVSIENSITYPAAIHVGDVLTAVAREDAASGKLSYYS